MDEPSPPRRPAHLVAAGPGRAGSSWPGQGRGPAPDAGPASLSSRAAERPDTDDVFADLVAELQAFRDGVTRPNGLGMVGAMLQDATDPELRALFRERVVSPRRARIEHILGRGIGAGVLDRRADLAIAVAACTGTFYALALADRGLDDWPERTAAMVWRACGGTPPVPSAGSRRGRARSTSTTTR